MGAMVAVFVERYAGDAWREEPRLRASVEMDFVRVLRRKKPLVNRGIPNDASPELEAALSELGEEFGEESWATLEELAKLPWGEVIHEKRLLGPILWRQRRESGGTIVRGSLVNDGTPALLEKFGARLVSNAEMDAYLDSEAFARETKGLTDGQCKLFTTVDLTRTLAEEVGFDDMRAEMSALGDPDSVRLIWTIGP